MTDDELWFVGKDMAAILDYSRHRDALSRHVDEDDAVKHSLIDSMGRIQETISIKAGGLFNFVGLKGLHKLTHCIRHNDIVNIP